jgi:hypothetical protein
MSLINLRHLPKHCFVGLIIPHIQTFHNEIGVLCEQNITLKNNTFRLDSKSSYNYTISELNKTTILYTHITSIINQNKYDIHEKITIKKNSNEFKKENYINYSINIVDNSKPIIYSIKCIEQPMAVDLMKHYTEEIKKIYKTFL